MNKTLFKSRWGKRAPKADTINEAGGAAYSLSAEAALAQMAATCTFGNAYYTSAEDQLNVVMDLLGQVSTEFMAKTAVFARSRGFMKDMPALLCCALMTRGDDEGLEALKKIFPTVIDNGRMLRGFMKILRSDVVGRKNVGSCARKLIHQLFDRVPAEVLFRWSVGNDPSLADVIRMVHPKPNTKEKEALYGYLLGKPHSVVHLPPLVKEFETFKLYKAGKIKGNCRVPAVPFQMIDSLPLTTAEWMSLFETGGWHFVRMNLNTAQRHGILNNATSVQKIAARLRDADAIRKSRVFPYQLLAAYRMFRETGSAVIGNALQDAMEIAIENTPELSGELAVCIDTSGSMGSPITGDRGSATSAVSCVDVAGLVAATLVRKNPNGTTVVPFDTSVHMIELNPRDSVMTNARKLARNGGGTDCGCALKYLNANKYKANLVVYVSDNEAWVDLERDYYSVRRAPMAREWEIYKSRCPQARLVNINIQPYATSQMAEGTKDVYQIGGFSDQIFTLISEWLAGRTANYWVETIKQIDLGQSSGKMTEESE